ncbi:MAG: DUF3604 domain-containing protein [bacterium]|nr:hypothetical protein [Deltaproteobacteria bacterium]MCP4906968.1 DUF3604 domain-containing protein [bacterium]
MSGLRCFLRTCASVSLNSIWAIGILVAAPNAISAEAEVVLPELFWGDTHVHSSYSLDANLFNNFSLGPESAYRFARGERVRTGRGDSAKLSRPLDFLVVSDHAEYMGVFAMIRDGHPAVAGSQTAKKVKQLMIENPLFGPDDINVLNGLLNGDPMAKDEKLQRLVWDDMIDIAERMNEPGRFTAIVGYEWGSTPGGNNLHRNVLFRDGPDRTKQILPFSAVHSDQPEKLWAFLAEYERRTGGEAFAIPHNSNLSNGLMFAVEDSSGAAIGIPYARARLRYEPVVEVTQIKGDSETHPFLSPDDEFADFDRWDKTNIFGLAGTEPEMNVGSYARSALKNGLLVQSKIGVNPFRFALIGSTDAHTSLATAEENNFWGKTANMPPGSDRMVGEFIHPRNPGDEATMNWEQAAAGYAGVWAAENTREAIFDAMRRGEVFASTGPRMNLRVFGGWRFSDVDARSSSPARDGYLKGVPMGADLPPRSSGGPAPSFLVVAAKDPESGNLQRVQIVKGWIDSAGIAQESVVDLHVAESLIEGEAEISVVWRDPDFDASALAFYYVRVLEVPTPRWNAIDAVRYGKPIAGMRVQHQERAYTSPIWYTPPAVTKDVASSN